MYEFSLQKSLYFELDPTKMDGVTEKEEDKGKKTFRTLPVSYESVPEITSITSEERKLPYLVRYYFYVNDEKRPADIHRPEVTQIIYEFYKDHFPDYLKEGLPDDVRGSDILDCFEVFHMPSYRPEYAWPGIVHLDDLRAGRVPDKRPKYAYPGLEVLENRDKLAAEMSNKGGGAALAGLSMLFNRSDRDPDKPAISEYDGYEELDGDLGKTRSKIEDMKKKLAMEMKALNIDERLKDIPEAQVDNTRDVLDEYKKKGDQATSGESHGPGDREGQEE